MTVVEKIDWWYVLDDKDPAFITANNKFYTPTNASLPFTTADDCPGGKNVTHLSDWQQLGYDIGSSISYQISLSDILALARFVLFCLIHVLNVSFYQEKARSNQSRSL
jgi:hypothetical protein